MKTLNDQYKHETQWCDLTQVNKSNSYSLLY